MTELLGNKHKKTKQSTEFITSSILSRLKINLFQAHNTSNTNLLIYVPYLLLAYYYISLTYY